MNLPKKFSINKVKDVLSNYLSNGILLNAICSSSFVKVSNCLWLLVFFLKYRLLSYRFNLINPFFTCIYYIFIFLFSLFLYEIKISLYK